MKKEVILHNIAIEKIGYGGIGIAKMPDGKKILIKGGALPGTVADLRIVKQRKDYIEAHILNIISYDHNLITEKCLCPHFFSSFNKEQTDLASTGCGGCKRQMLAYEQQCKLKEDIVDEAFTRIRKSGTEVIVKPIIPSPQITKYRNKIEFSFGKYITTNRETKELDIISDRSLGFHKQGEFSKIINITNCALISDRANAIQETIRQILVESGLPVYDQKTQHGVFRHLVLREGTNTQQMLVNLSISDKEIISEEDKNKREQLLVNLKTKLEKDVTSCVISINNGLGDVVHSPETTTSILRGEGHMYEKLSFLDEEQTTQELQFRVSPFSFFQTNTLGAQKLFQEAMNMVGHTEGMILDLYCGTGTIGLSFLKANKGNKLLGIEIVEDAIVDARHNAQINGLKNISDFRAYPAEKAFTKEPDMKEKLKELGLVIIDPPRDGLHPNVITILEDLKREHSFKLLYISCNPITMARDVALLIEKGFKLQNIQPVDMFPQTHHIETIGVLI